MTVRTCPFCGNYSVVEVTGEYRFVPPPNIPGGDIVIPNATWRECNECSEVMLPSDLCDSIDAVWMKRTNTKPKPRKPRKKVTPPKYHFVFRVEEKFFKRKDWDRVYLPGETRTVDSMLGGNSELEARRNIIHHNMELGVQILKIELLDCDLWENVMGNDN